MEAGMPPPMPSPVRKRAKVKVPGSVAKAVARDIRPNSATHPISTGFRPSRSPSQPQTSEPRNRPILPAVSAAVKATGFRCQASDSAGRVKAIAPRSKPSRTRTPAHNMATRFSCPAGAALIAGDLSSERQDCPVGLRWDKGVCTTTTGAGMDRPKVLFKGMLPPGWSAIPPERFAAHGFDAIIADRDPYDPSAIQYFSGFRPPPGFIKTLPNL